jgi:hypothetical protein
MPTHEPIDDAALGPVAWNESTREWEFSTSVPERGVVRGRIVREAWETPLGERELSAIRERVQWVRENEQSVRERIAGKMFDGWWLNGYDAEVHTVTTKQGFRDAIQLAAIDILEDGLPMLTYADAELFGGHVIVLNLTPDGEIDGEPDLWG